MKWSLRIGTVAGIGIFVHWTFVLLIGWVVYLHLRHGESWGVALEGVGFILAVFACIVLHELGHALTARRYGIQTRDITLLPIGGLARLERIPEDPRQELWVAAAGPAVNVVIAGVLYVVVVASGAMAPITSLAEAGGSFLTKLMWVNLFLVAFNLIPAFPMDGGRVLRAVLATSMEYSQATAIAATVGQLIAIGFGLLGLLFNPFLLFIAIFVYLGAQQEAHAASIRSVMRGLPVRDAMIVHFRTLAPEETLAEAVEELRAGAQQDFPVVEGGQVVGLLTREDLLAALHEHGVDHPVSEYMRRDCLVVEDGEMLDRTFERMREKSCSSLAVTRRGELIGLLTLENVGELMMLSSAMRRSSSRGEVDDIYRT